MSNEMDTEATPQFCITSRFGLISWACGKIILDIIVLIYMVDPVVDIIMYSLTFFEYLGWFITILMMAILIVDIVFQGKLIHGLRKDTVNHLTAYCKYTKILWMYMLISVAGYLIHLVSGFGWYLFRYSGMENAAIINIYSMAVGTLFQSFMMLLVTKEIKNMKGENYQAHGGTIKVFNIVFSVKVETSCTEKFKENDSSITDAEETHTLEKKQLPV